MVRSLVSCGTGRWSGLWWAARQDGGQVFGELWDRDVVRSLVSCETGRKSGGSWWAAGQGGIGGQTVRPLHSPMYIHTDTISQRHFPIQTAQAAVIATISYLKSQETSTSLHVKCRASHSRSRGRSLPGGIRARAQRPAVRFRCYSCSSLGRQLKPNTGRHSKQDRPLPFWRSLRLACKCYFLQNSSESFNILKIPIVKIIQSFDRKFTPNKNMFSP